MIDTPSGFRVTRGQENYAGANNLPISQLLSSNDVRSKITFRKPMKRPVNQKDEDDGDSAPVKCKASLNNKHINGLCSEKTRRHTSSRKSFSIMQAHRLC